MRYLLLCLVLLFMVAIPLMEISVDGKKYAKKIATNFSPFFSFALLPSSGFNLHVYFRPLCQTTFIEKPSLIRKEKITCENCGTQTTRNNIVQHKKRCSAGTMSCT